MESRTQNFKRHGVANAPVNVPKVYGGDHPISIALNGLQTLKNTSDRFFYGKDPIVKTADELEDKKIIIDAEITPAQKEYMAKRDCIFTAKIFSEEIIADALDARVAELEDAIQRAPLKGAASRGGNTLGNLLDLTNLAQKELVGKMQSKNALNTVLTDIINEEQDEVVYQTTNETKNGMIHDRNGKAIAYQVLDKDQRIFAESRADRLHENFEKGKIRLQEYMKTL